MPELAARNFVPKPIELQVLFPLTVSVKPSPIIMSSPAAGMVPPGHGKPATVELQLPLPVVVIVPANIFVLNIPAKRKNNITKENFVKVLAIMCLAISFKALGRSFKGRYDFVIVSHGI